MNDKRDFTRQYAKLADNLVNTNGMLTGREQAFR